MYIKFHLHPLDPLVAAVQLWPPGCGGASQQGARTEEGVARWLRLPIRGLLRQPQNGRQSRRHNRYLQVYKSAPEIVTEVLRNAFCESPDGCDVCLLAATLHQD